MRISALRLKKNQIFNAPRFIILCSLNGLGMRRYEKGQKCKFLGSLRNPILSKNWAYIEIDSTRGIVNPKALLRWQLHTFQKRR